MKRKDWQEKARGYSKSARTLLRERDHSSAYYLSGIAVECALKAKIAKRFRAGEIPNDKLVRKIYTHDLTELVGLAQLDDALAANERADLAFRALWNTVKLWNIDSRYKSWTAAEATEMVEAATKRRSGVLAWIKRYW